MSYMRNERQIIERKEKEARVHAALKVKEMTSHEIADFLGVSLSCAKACTTALRNDGLISTRPIGRNKFAFFVGDAIRQIEEAKTIEQNKARDISTRKAALKNADVQAKIPRNWFGGAV